MCDHYFVVKTKPENEMNKILRIILSENSENSFFQNINQYLMPLFFVIIN